MADLTHCRKGKKKKKKQNKAKPQSSSKNKAKLQLSSKNNQSSKQNCNLKSQPTHSPISPWCLQIKLTNHCHRDPPSKPTEENWKGSSFIGSNPSREIASSGEPRGDQFQRARKKKKKKKERKGGTAGLNREEGKNKKGRNKICFLKRRRERKL